MLLYRWDKPQKCLLRRWNIILLGLLNNSGSEPVEASEETPHLSEREYSKKFVQQGRSHAHARSVLSVREHGRMARTPLAAFFNIPLFGLLIFALEWGVNLDMVGAQSVAGIRGGRSLSFSRTGIPSLSRTGVPFRSGGGLRAPIESKGMPLGPLRLHPYFGFFEIYTDNAFRRNTQKEHDFTHVFTPGFQASLPIGTKHRFLLDYGYTKRLNQRFSSNDVDTIDAYGRLTLSLPKQVNVDLQSGHSEGFELRGTAVDSQSLEPNKWRTNTVLGRVEVAGAWAGARLSGRWTQWRFSNNNQGITRDRGTTVGNLTLFGSITPHTSALFSVNLTNQSYVRNKQLNSFSYRVSTGLTWDITGQTQGQFRAGYEVLNFDRAPIQSPGLGLSAGGDKRDNLFFTGNLQWKPTSRISLNLWPSRTIRQTAVANSTTFTQTVINLNVDYDFTTRTQLFGFLGYINDNFSNSITLDGQTGGREDDTITAGVGVDYKTLRWLGFRMDYRYQKRDSSFSRFNFTANTIIFSVEILF